MKDCIAIDPAGDCGSLATYGLPETWDTSQVTDMSYRALPRAITREDTNPTVIAWFLSCGGPCALWIMGGLRPVVRLCGAAAQCSMEWMGRPPSTNLSAYGTCPR